MEYIDTLKRLLNDEPLRVEGIAPDTRYRFGDDAPLDTETVTKVRPLVVITGETDSAILVALSGTGRAIARMHVENAGKVVGS